MAHPTIQSRTSSTGTIEGSSKKKIYLFDIVLNSGSDYYLPGEDITGQVYVHCTKRFKTKGIVVRLLGSCFVSDSKRHNHNNDENYRAHYTRLQYQDKTYDGTYVSNHTFNTQDMRKYYKDTELYFHIRQQVWGGFNTKEYLEVGEYAFPFSITLPLGLPTSFEGTKGYIRYTATAKIKRQRAPSVCCTKIFAVCPKVPLANVPNAQNPVIVHDSKYFGFMMFKSGPISAKVSLNRKGFLPGETILLNAEVVNNTHKDITLVSAALLSIVTYRVHGEIKEEKTTLIQITQGVIRHHENDIWKNRELYIPQVPPSGLNGCGLIIMEYRVQFTISSPLGSDMEIVLPVFIGAEPSASNLSVTSAAMAANEAPPRPPRASHMAKQQEVEASMQQYSIPEPNVRYEGATAFMNADIGHESSAISLPPPSYDECIASDQNATREPLEMLFLNKVATLAQDGQGDGEDDMRNDEQEDEPEDEPEDEQDGAQNDDHPETIEQTHDSEANENNNLLIDLGKF